MEPNEQIIQHNNSISAHINVNGNDIPFSTRNTQTVQTYMFYITKVLISVRKFVMYMGMMIFFLIIYVSIHPLIN